MAETDFFKNSILSQPYELLQRFDYPYIKPTKNQTNAIFNLFLD